MARAKVNQVLFDLLEPLHVAEAERRRENP